MAYRCWQWRSQVHIFSVNLQKLLQVAIINGVLQIGKQIAFVRARVHHVSLVHVLGAYELVSLFPKYQKINVKTAGKAKVWVFDKCRVRARGWIVRKAQVRSHRRRRRRLEIVTQRRLHHFVECLIRHVSREQQLSGADVIQRQGLYPWYVHAQVPVDATALYAYYYAEVRRQPRGVWKGDAIVIR